jgi:WD40 repeat protein
VALPHDGEIDAVAYTPDGRTLITAGRGRPPRLWDLTAVRPTIRAELSGCPDGIRALLVTPDGGTVVGVGDGPRVVNWDVRTGRPVREWELPGGPISGAALTADGRYLGAGGPGGMVDLYRVAEKRQ